MIPANAADLRVVSPESTVDKLRPRDFLCAVPPHTTASASLSPTTGDCSEGDDAKFTELGEYNSTRNGRLIFADNVLNAKEVEALKKFFAEHPKRSRFKPNGLSNYLHNQF